MSFAFVENSHRVTAILLVLPVFLIACTYQGPPRNVLEDNARVVG
jgi:hypothetical protein